jgi:hypothetical protein
MLEFLGYFQMGIGEREEGNLRRVTKKRLSNLSLWEKQLVCGCSGKSTYYLKLCQIFSQW